MKYNSFYSALSAIKQVSANTRKLLTLSWKMDSRLTMLYYLTTGIGALIPVIISYLLKILIDNLQIAQQISPTIPLIVIVVLAARYVAGLFEDLIYWTFNQSYLDYLFRYKLQNEITLKFHKKVSHLDIAYFERPQTQDLITTVRDTMQWRVADYVRIFSYWLRDIIAYIAAFIVLIPFGWGIPVLVTLVTIPRLYLKARYGSLLWSIWGSGAAQGRKLWYFNYLLQDPTAVREMRIFQSTDTLLKKFQDTTEQLYRLHKKPLDIYLKISSIPAVLEVVIIIFLSYLFLPDVTSGALTIGTFTLLISMLEQLKDRSANASAKIGELYENNLFVDDYFKLLSLPKLIKESDNPIIFDGINPPRIEFKNVSFQYENGPTILKNVSFIIEPGENIAFVGHNGAGKTTIVKLLCRFYDVTEGEILINNVNIKNLKLDNWYAFLGTLFQEFVNYHFSVRENITLGDPTKNDQHALEEAAHKSGASGFINELPRKYDQALGTEFEEGTELSGGQWQKLAIARAFYENPPVLILDEPTSAIDAEAEYEIFNNLEKQYKKKTLILVSHRFSTVRNADRIIVISNGKVSEMGSHEELMKKKGEYEKMFSIQAKGYVE